MPRYDFRCDEGHEFEASAHFDQDTLRCPILVKDTIDDDVPCEAIAHPKAVYTHPTLIFN